MRIPRTCEGRLCGPGMCEGRRAGVLRLCMEGVQTAVMCEDRGCRSRCVTEWVLVGDIEGKGH